MSIRFAWDKSKAVSNRKNHEEVTFEEAATVFRDQLASILNGNEWSANAFPNPTR
jgi:uncharacterized DUF497 family protein